MQGEFSPFQHGFISGKSCLSNLLETVELILHYLDNGNEVDLIYFVRHSTQYHMHSRLLIKLQSFGITGNTLAIIENFLTNRWMAVRVGDSMARWRSVLSEVPQGSVIGPLLFALFINDLPESVKSAVKLFADDVKLIGDANDLAGIQDDLDSISTWKNDWCMEFNSEKCTVMHIGKNDTSQRYHLEENELVIVGTEKDLGVTFSESFDWSEHIEQSIGKANKTQAWILRNILSRDADVLLPLYKSTIRPHLKYCVQVWAPRTRYGNWKVIMELENCQRKLTIKSIRGLEDLSYRDRLIKLGLTTVLERRARGDLIEIFKIESGFVAYGQHMFRKGSTGRQFLLTPATSSQSYQDQFKCRSTMYWNRLPLEYLE